MFDELKKYEHLGTFIFRLTDDLRRVCNAPSDKSGVYVAYARKGRTIELVYVGRSGKIKADGKMFVRKAGLGGIKDRIVNGHQFGKIARKNSWPRQMKTENIDVLEIWWYVTHDTKVNDCPITIEKKLLNAYIEDFTRLPRWNKKR
jgi:hypothetical protein